MIAESENLQAFLLALGEDKKHDKQVDSMTVYGLKSTAIQRNRVSRLSIVLRSDI